MTILDGGGGIGGEVTTLSRPVFHRSGTGSTGSAKQKQQLTASGVYTCNDINANNTARTNGTVGETYTQLESGFQRVPESNPEPVQFSAQHAGEQALSAQRATSSETEENQHDLKKWSDVCKVEPDVNGGDTNNNHSMDYSN